LFLSGKKAFTPSLVIRPPSACLRRDISRLEIHRQGEKARTPSSKLWPWNQFALDRPLNQAVLELQPDKLCPASKLRKDICLGDPPGGASEMPT